MHLTHVLLFAVCLAGAIPRAAANASVPSPDDVPPNLVLDGLEVPDAALRAAVRPYLEFRPTTFQDWHPSRRGMLVLSREGQTPQLHEVRVPSGRRRPIAAFSERVAGGAYAPGSGDPIVMMADRGGDEFYQLFRVAGSDNEPVLLTDGRSRNTGPRWSDRGTLLAYVSTRRNGRDTDLYVMDPRKPETDRRVAELPGGGWRVLDGSPDDRRLLLVEVISAVESRLHVVDVASGVRRRLTPEGGERSSDADAEFLPDGRTALIATDRGAEHRYLARLDLETGSLERFGPELAWGVEALDVSPDGTMVAVVTNEDGIGVLRLLEAGTGRELPCPKIPAGVLSDLRWHPAGRILGFTLSSARSASDAYAIDTRRRTLTRWTRSDVGGARTSSFVEPERVRVRSFDGRDVSAWLYRPKAERHPGKRPVLIHIHGGPEGQARPQFQRAWNYLVEELGVALLFPNVRGSDGYGRSFLALDDGFRREDAVRDIGAFLDWIGDRPDLDAGRVAAYGGSYGGYMVLASLVHHGDRLRCGIDVVGISNFGTFLRNTQDYRRDLRRVEYGDERDPAMAAFLERISPANQAARIRKPLLVVQGRNDPRVPVTESEQMVKAIRDRGGSVAYLMAKDEGHGFVRKANADFLFVAVVDFLRRHLLDRDGSE